MKFVDESGVSISMTRLYGRAEGGQRVVDSVHSNCGENLSIIGALSSTGISAAMTISGPVDGDAFLAYVKRILVPTLTAGDIVVMDNYNVHKMAVIRKAIRRAKASILFLPPYSPDLSPIELCWSKIKSFLRSKESRSFLLLQDAISDAFSSISSSDILGWFNHSGYFFP